MEPSESYRIKYFVCKSFNHILYQYSINKFHNKNRFIFIQSAQDYFIVEKNKQLSNFITQDNINKCKNIKSGMIYDVSILLLNANKPSCEF